MRKTRRYWSVIFIPLLIISLALEDAILSKGGESKHQSSPLVNTVTTVLGKYAKYFISEMNVAGVIFQILISFYNLSTRWNLYVALLSGPLIYDYVINKP